MAGAPLAIRYFFRAAPCRALPHRPLAYCAVLPCCGALLPPLQAAHRPRWLSLLTTLPRRPLVMPCRPWSCLAAPFRLRTDLATVVEAADHLDVWTHALAQQVRKQGDGYLKCFSEGSKWVSTCA